MKSCITATAFLGLFSGVFAQNIPFPQDNSYPDIYNASRSIVSSAQVKQYYEEFKQTYFTECTDQQLRVAFDPPGELNYGHTVSEGQAYGMLMAAYFGEKDNFDKMWNYTRQVMFNANQVMGWRTTCTEFVRWWKDEYDAGFVDKYGHVSATDGDIDAIHALLVADAQWGGTYLQQAREYINRLKTHNFNNINGRWIQKPGDDNGRNDHGNTSYFCPAYYVLFKDVTGDSDWDKIREDTYFQLQSAAHPETGLPGNEVYVDGRLKQDKIDYNFPRIPWRLVTDYAWTGNSEAKALLDKMNTWFVSKGPGNIPDGTEGATYAGNPGVAPWYESPAFVGAYAVGLMAHSQEQVDLFTDFFLTKATAKGYYGDALRVLYLLSLTGNFWMPGQQIENGDFRLEYTIDGQGSVSALPNKIWFDAGETVTLNAEPKPRHIFSGWSGAQTSSSPTLTLTMDADKEITAHFSVDPSAEIIDNGDFSQGDANWTFFVFQHEEVNAQAQLSTVDGEARISITDPGTAAWNVQLLQQGLPLDEQSSYTLEFDATAQLQRTISVAINQLDPNVVYLDSTVTLSTQTQTYRLPFSIESYNNQKDARLEFNAGNNASALSLDNIRIIKDGATSTTASLIPAALEKRVQLSVVNGQITISGTQFQKKIGVTLHDLKGRHIYSHIIQNPTNSVALPHRKLSNQMVIVSLTAGTYSEQKRVFLK